LTNSEEVILDTGMRILLWPNPVSEVLQIDIGNIQNFSGKFVLRNAFGQMQRQIDMHSGQRRYRLPVYDLQSGMYFYDISSEGQSVKSGRVVVQ
ncbi:MAG TPA: T9SS type A sorting domain-containing protein, partial [Saprospiraceae bacterium]|nr:T9SS type A sorting domain-containing protein [Saprospiraceae bacterium]